MRSFVSRTRPFSDRLTTLGVVIIAAAAACIDPIAPTDKPPANVTLQPACAAARGTIHSQLPVGSRTWRRAESPHWVMATLLVRDGTLTIEAGTAVCFGAGAQLQIADSARLEVRGTSAAPVVLTAMDPAEPWGGIQGHRLEFGGTSATAGQVSLRHTRLEYADVGVAVHSFILDSTVIRQIRGPAISSSMRTVATGGYFVEGSGRVTGSAVDTACTMCGSGGAAIDVATSRLVIEETDIRGSGGHGVRASGGTLSLRDVVIHGSAKVGLVMSRVYNPRQGDPAATFETPVSVRITAGGSHPAEILTALVNDLIPDAAALDRLRGNANDALMLLGGTGRDVVIRAGMPSFLAGDPSSFAGGGALISAHLHMEPGASLRILAPTTVRSGGRITAEGTADRPVILSTRPIDFSGEPAASGIMTARAGASYTAARSGVSGAGRLPISSSARRRVPCSTSMARAGRTPRPASCSSISGIWGMRSSVWGSTAPSSALTESAGTRW